MRASAAESYEEKRRDERDIDVSTLWNSTKEWNQEQRVLLFYYNIAFFCSRV